MGASTDGRYYRPDPRKGAKGTGALKTEREIRDEVAKKFRRDCEQDAHENGHSYSGTIAMTGRRIDRWLDLKLEDKGRYKTQRWRGEERGWVETFVPEPKAEAKEETAKA